MKRALQILLWVLIAIILLVCGFVLFLDIREYDPDPVVVTEIAGQAKKAEVPCGESLSVLTWNTGYCALGKDADFIMDGGGNAPNADEELVRTNIDGIQDIIDSINPDFLLLQEVDSDSSRSYNIDERECFERGNSSYALNYSCDFVPYPWPPLGKIHSGVFTTTEYEIESAQRNALPCPFSWPLRLANLKRCMLVTYFPIEGSDKKLVMINFHLEAYDSGEGKRQQTRQLSQFIDEEYEKGNYVIAGGDWNQSFPTSTEVYPNTHMDLWEVKDIDADLLGNVVIAYDLSNPTCRLLNQPYNPTDEENTQYYVIDGFVFSPNIQYEGVETINANFEYSDHNPVLMKFSLLPEN